MVIWEFFLKIHIKKQSDIRYALKLCVSDSNHFAHLDLMSVVLYVHSLKTTPTEAPDI